MYSRRVIDLVIEDWSAQKDSSGNRINFEPRYHTIAEIDEFNDYIRSIMKNEGGQTADLWLFKNPKAITEQRVRWMKKWQKNEKFLCMADAEYFISRYCKIRTVDERIVRIEFRIGQKIFLKILQDFDDIQKAIQVFVLKCRQVGISTAVAMFFLQRILTRSNTHAIMASASIPQSEKLNIMIQTAIKELPFWLPPGRNSVRAKEPRWENGSAMSIQAGSQTVAIAEGSSPSCIHLSEIADYDKPVVTIEQGLFPAAHQTSSLFFVMEGTGDIASPWQKEKWEFYKAHRGQPGGRFQTVFIPPCCAPDIYPHSDWIRSNPVPEEWYQRRHIETKRMCHRAELFVKSTEYLAEWFGDRWEVPLEYQWYWECGYKEAEASNSVKTYLSQNAVTDMDAFQSKFDPVFKDEVIEIITGEKKRDYKAYAITGKTIVIGSDNRPYFPDEHEIDYGSERIELHWEANDGNQYGWVLVPLLPFDDSTDESCFNKLLVFEEPQPGAIYSQAVDTAAGLGLPKEERACCSVLRNQYGKKRDIQAAEFTSTSVNSAQMSRIAAAIAVYYTTDGLGNNTSGMEAGMRFIIEQVRKAGDECALQLQLMGFYNHHHMHFYDDRDSLTVGDKGRKIGWRTGEWSRQILLDKFVNYINGGWFKPNSPILIRQLKTFIRKKKPDETKSRMMHDSGEFDDNVFAAAMALITAHDVENESSRIQEKYAAPERLATANDGWCTAEVYID